MREGMETSEIRACDTFESRVQQIKCSKHNIIMFVHGIQGLDMKHITHHAHSSIGAYLSELCAGGLKSLSPMDSFCCPFFPFRWL